jgi:hypothetical protein
MHWANVRMAAFWAALTGGLGWAALNWVMHVLRAAWKDGARMSMLDGSWEPRIEMCEPPEPPPGEAPGSGNRETPWARMHAANFTVPGPGPDPV